MLSVSDKENKPDAIKFKFGLERNEKQDITTLLYITKEEDTTIERSLITDPSIDDFIKYIPFKSTVRCIFQIVKIWTQPSTLKTPTYGLTLKVIKIEVKEKLNDKLSCDFIDAERFDISSEEINPLDEL